MTQLPGRSFADKLRHFKAERVQKRSAEIVRESVREFSGSLVTQWSPYGDPKLWNHPPPKDYVPGNFRSSWFLSINSPSTEQTDATDRVTVNHADLIEDITAGPRVYISNSAPHAGALESCHSSQAPTGIMVHRAEFLPIVYAVARPKVAG